MKSEPFATNQTEQALTIITGASLPVERHPAIGYLSALRTDGGRRVQTEALASVARLLRHDLAKANHQNAIMGIEWHTLTNSHLKAISTQLSATLAPKTANRKLDAVRGVLKQAWLNGLMSRDEYERAIVVERIPGSREKRGRDISSGELRALFESCASDKSKTLGARDAALLALLCGGGLRRAEVAALTFADWNTDACEVKFIGKGNKERIVPLPEGTCRALKAWLLVRGTGEPEAPLLCPVTKGGKIEPRPMTTQAIWKGLQTRALKAGVPRLSPHDFRRTFVGDLLEAGADLSTVSKLAGHADTKTTAGYDRRPAEARRKAVGLLHVPFGG